MPNLVPLPTGSASRSASEDGDLLTADLVTQRPTCLLQDHNLTQVQKPEGMIERTIDGQKRVFEHPKQAQLTNKGQEHLTENPPQKYEDLSHEELVQRVRSLEDEIENLRNSLETFREQVQKRL